MGIFGPTNEELEEIKKRLFFLEERTKNINDEYYEKSKSSFDSILSLSIESDSKSKKITSILQELEIQNRRLNDELENLENSLTTTEEKKTALENNINLIDSKINEIIELEIQFRESNKSIEIIKKDAENFLTEASTLPSALENAQLNLQETESVFKNIKNTYSHIANKKNEIDDIYKEIYGEKIKNDDGTEIELEGIRDKLEKSYEATSEKILKLEETIKNQINSINESYNIEVEIKNNKFEDLINTSYSRYENINNQLKELLPGAMAKGLSHAYEVKRRTEALSLAALEKNFRNCILALVATSLIPIATYLSLIFIKNKDLFDVIKETPNITLATLPIYLPLLWLAYSTSKKANLSKRLIEEYTHKSVLGKTFSGLSNQIETLKNQDNIKDELRTKLLFSILEVSAENPGKLITDYNKSDHPLFDVIQKSSDLSDSLENLSKIPGIGVISKKISEKIEKKLEDSKIKVEKAIGSQE